MSISALGRVGLAIALVGGGLFATTSPAAATPAWSIETTPSPNSPSTISLEGVACITASNCFGVGGYTFDGFVTAPLIEQWDGAAWSLVPSPTVPGITSGHLAGIACPTSTSCYAVGGSFLDVGTGETTLVEHWNGSAWSIVASANPDPFASLAAVACLSNTNCFGVGVRSSAQTSKPLVEHWDGAHWSVAAAPGVTGTPSELVGVACPRPERCLAVGDSGDAGNQRALTERWNGSTWSIVPSPAPAGTQPTALVGVACAAPGNCFAAGRYFDDAQWRPLLEHWDGTHWSLSSAPRPAGNYALLSGVTCPDATRCLAVGTYSGASKRRTLIEQWNGSTWSIIASPNPLGAIVGEFFGVACHTRAACVAVGGDTGTGASYAARGNGTQWTLTHPVLPVGSSTELLGVACATSTTCFAVGYRANGVFNFTPLIEQWNGTSWSVVPVPASAGVAGSALVSITCPASNRCLAVGVVASGHTYAVHWDGSSWSVVPSPDPPHADFSEFLGVTCAAPGNCFAVGLTSTAVANPPDLIEHWNGTGWALVPSHAPPNFDVLQGVSCASPMSCFAVGYQIASNASADFIEQWNGQAWTPIPAAAPVAGSLTAVSCPGVNTCFAVGTSVHAERWNGSHWSSATLATPTGATQVVFDGIECMSTTDCVAVGGSLVAGAFTPLTERWDGLGWSILSTPVPAASPDSTLGGIACASPTTCFAVGSFKAGAQRPTLIEKYEP